MPLERMLADLTNGNPSCKEATDTLYCVAMIKPTEADGHLSAIGAVLCTGAYLFSGISAADVRYAPCSRHTPPHAPLF